MPARTRYTARWLLPVTAAPIENGALLVDDGRIVAVGADDDVARPPDAEAIDLGEAALLPGLVNAHAHPELTALRGLLEDLPFHEWIPTLRRIKLRGALTDPDLRLAARWLCAEAAAAGVTTIAATEDSDATLHALRASGLRGVVYREVFGPAPEQATDALAGLRRHVDAMRAEATDLVTIGISPHAPYTVSDALFRGAAEYAQSEALPVAIHVAESAAESELVAHGTGRFADALNRRDIATPARAASPVALLERLRVLDTQPLLIHCVRLDGHDIERIAKSGARVAHCPVANARLGHGIAPVATLLEAGVTVGLGTDSMASNNRLDLLEEARTAQLMQRAALGSPDALPSATLLRMATLDGARALGLDDRIGALEPGRDADLCAVSLAGTHVRPVQDPLVALFHSARASDVVLTVVRGRVVYRREEPGDLEEIGARIDALGRRLRTARDAS